MKKFLAIVMCLAMALSMMTVVSFAAADTISLGSVTCKAGATVEIPMIINGTTAARTYGIATVTFASPLTVNGFNFSLEKDVDIDGTSSYTNRTVAGKKMIGVTCVFFEDVACDNTEVGKFSVTVPEGTAAGDYTITFKTSVKTAGSTAVTYEAVAGKVTVEGDEPEASATIIEAPTAAGPNGGVVKVLQAKNVSEFGIKYVGTNATYNGKTFKSLATGTDVTAAVEVVGLDNAFEAYYVK